MVKTILMIKSDYLKFLKKKEVVGRPIVDKMGKLKTFYLPLSKWIYSVYQKDKKTKIIGLSGGQGAGKSTITSILKLYQYYTKTAKHYFCSVCGIHTHNRPRIDPKIYGINIACVEGVKPFELKNIPVNDGENHPHDKK